LKVEPDDILAECQFAMNTGFSLNGTTPYACLFGALPTALFDDDDEFITPHDGQNVFYDHLLIRTKAISLFHQTMIAERLEKTMSARPRTSLE